MLFFFIVNCAFFAITVASNNSLFSSKRLIISTTILVIINLTLCIFVFFAKQKKWSIEKVFLIIGSTLGILYLFIIPMGRAPDEPAHIWRVYSISQGEILIENQDNINGNYLPENIANFNSHYTNNAYESIASDLSEPISDQQIFHKTIGSNPIDYLPQIIGTLIGRLLHLPMIAVLYLARLCGLITCIIIIYFCLKFIPIVKKSLFFLACLPLSMQTFISISYDGLIICSAIALITFVLYSIYQKNLKFNFLHYLILAILGVALISAKPVYFPLCLILFFIPYRCFKNKKYKIISIITILLITIGTFLLWSALSIVTEPGNGANTSGQISYIMSNPIQYIVVLIHNILNMPFVYLQRLGFLEWFDVHTSEFYIISTLIFFTILCAEEYITANKLKLSKSFRWSLIIIFATITILIFTALYIQWTQVGSPIIEGVQTRYLLPVFIIIPILLSSIIHRPSSSKEKLVPHVYLYSFIIFLNLNAITILLCAHL